MEAPRIVFDETRAVYRVEYAGMAREHRQEWQAQIWYQDALSAYGHEAAGPAPAAKEA